jgi:hypothetical protein
MAERRRRPQISEKAQDQRLISDWQPQLGLRIRLIHWLLLNMVSNATTVNDGKGFTSIIRFSTYRYLPLTPSDEVLLCKLVYSGALIIKIAFASLNNEHLDIKLRSTKFESNVRFSI